MIYAIATTDQALSHQFSKSQSFTFYNQEKEVIAVYKNPALDAKCCSAKQLIVELFKKMKCDLVIVRKIGEKTLARLLDAGFKVEQGNTRNSFEELLNDAANNKNSLTSAEQGVKKKKEKCHSEKCSHTHEEPKKSCCGKH